MAVKTKTPFKLLCSELTHLIVLKSLPVYYPTNQLKMGSFAFE
jgi:hypothetical protein